MSHAGVNEYIICPIGHLKVLQILLTETSVKRLSFENNLNFRPSLCTYSYLENWIQEKTFLLKWYAVHLLIKFVVLFCMLFHFTWRLKLIHWIVYQCLHDAKRCGAWPFHIVCALYRIFFIQDCSIYSTDALRMIFFCNNKLLVVFYSCFSLSILFYEVSFSALKYNLYESYVYVHKCSSIYRLILHYVSHLCYFCLLYLKMNLYQVLSPRPWFINDVLTHFNDTIE